ncbi:hypothetical protein BDV96DRAFT_491203 [Lophiotrema nucula]|uniref:Uncharacterized protein n=1 Tax=Lophiotrema nucula TaxID=690887 RepID=A0A6A5ZDH2_9PLEO|nr:hypothetical protein BDV96DRAFT_491203 [Lophiotrema nucula]
MPVQHTIFGRPVTLQMPPRRFQLLFSFILFLIVYFALYGPPATSDLPSYQDAYEGAKDFVKDPHLPSLQDVPTVPNINPFAPSAHKPPVQPNSTTSSSTYRGAVEWLSDFKWRNPFSSSITLDENRAVLPPLKERPPIYTFYDVKGKQDKAVSEAENRLILAWRRAWWAQGFKPVVLSRLEAMKHPQYQQVQRLKLDSATEMEMMRWLAWGRMSGGVLANWLALPMAQYDNPMLAFLRRKEYPILSRVDTLGHGVFFGEDAAVNAAIKKAIDNPLLKNVTANKDKIEELGKKDGGVMVNLLSGDDIKVDSKANGIAYYSTTTIAKNYETVAKKLDGNTTHVEGLDLLAELINSHLQLTFQATFADGVAVVKPLAEHTTALMYEAIDIARNLTQCPTSPIPKSCPPNNAKCTPCSHDKTPKIQLLSSFQNSSTRYTIGTVPHPYTFNLLHYTRDSLDADFLRQKSRDVWIEAATNDFVGKDHSSADRVIHFKEVVASPVGFSNSLWLTAERESQHDINWVFGFNLPQKASYTNEPSSPSDKSELIIFPRPEPPAPLEGVSSPEAKWIKNEEERLQKARDAIKSKDRRMQEVVEMVEKWNLADTEAWRFARAWSGRRRVEREMWEKEEGSYAGAEKKAGPGGAGGRWSDRRR